LRRISMPQLLSHLHFLPIKGVICI